MYSVILFIHTFFTFVYPHDKKNSINSISQHFNLKCETIKIKTTDKTLCDVFELHFSHASIFHGYTISDFQKFIISLILWDACDKNTIQVTQLLDHHDDTLLGDLINKSLQKDSFKSGLKKIYSTFNLADPTLKVLEKILDVSTLETLEKFGIVSALLKGHLKPRHEVEPPTVKGSWSCNIGILSAFFSWSCITILGFLGLALIPLKKYTKVYVFVLQLLIAMGFGTLTGDSVYHLIPHSFGDSHHSDTHHDHFEVIHEHDKEELLKWSIFILGAISLYFVELFMKVCPFTKNHKCGCHGVDEPKPPTLETHEKGTAEHYHGDHECINIEAVHDLQKSSASHRLGGGVPPEIISNPTKPSISPCVGDGIYEGGEDKIVILPNRGMDCSTVNQAKNVVLVLIFSDACHHVMDGLAIGANFSSDKPGAFSSGVSTTIAILFHELPHKIGDIVLLVRSGYSEKKASLIVVGSSSISLVGVAIGCFTSSATHASLSWINLFTAGMFFYIALVLMMGQMLNAITNPELPIVFIILAHALGMLIGFSTMVLIAKFEHFLS